MSTDVFSVGVQCNAKEENIKVLSGVRPTKDETKGALLNGDNNDCVENANVMNTLLRKNADGMSTPHMFQENGHVLSNKKTYARATSQEMTLGNASSNTRLIEEQNKVETTSNRNSFEKATAPKTGKQKQVSVTSAPEETLIKQGCKSLNDDEKMGEKLSQQACDVLSHESLESTCICDISEQVSEYIEHFEEKTYITENVTEPPQISLTNCSGNKIISENDAVYVHNENEHFAGDRHCTNAKYCAQASLSMSNAPIVTHVETVRKEEESSEIRAKDRSSNDPFCRKDDRRNKHNMIKCRRYKNHAYRIGSKKRPLLKKQLAFKKLTARGKRCNITKTIKGRYINETESCFASLKNKKNNKFNRIVQRVLKKISVLSCIQLKISLKGHHNPSERNKVFPNMCEIEKYIAPKIYKFFLEAFFKEMAGIKLSTQFNQNIYIYPGSRYQLDAIHTIQKDSLHLLRLKRVISHWHYAPFTELFLAPVRELTLNESVESDSIRRETFRNFEHQDIVDRLVRNGYFCSETEDEIICHLCRSSWRQGDVPERSHHPGCQYRDVSSQSIPDVSPVTELDNDTIDPFGRQIFGHSLNENATPEEFPNAPRVAYIARNKHNSLSDLDVPEGRAQNSGFRLLDDSCSRIERSSVPVMTHLGCFSERPQEERCSLSANQSLEEQLNILIDYFLRQRDPRGPRGGRPITVLSPLPNGGGRRRRGHLTALPPRTPVWESESHVDAAVNCSPYCCTYSHDNSNSQLGNNEDAHASCTRTESHQSLNRGCVDSVSDGIERRVCNLRHIQHLNYLTAGGRKNSQAGKRDRRVNKSATMSSTTRILRTNQQGVLGAENISEGVGRSDGDLRHIQRLNYLTTAGRKVLNAEQGDQNKGKSELVQYTGRIGHTDPGRCGSGNNVFKEITVGNLRHIQHLNYLTTDRRKVCQANERDQKTGKRPPVQSTGRMRHTHSRRLGVTDAGVISRSTMLTSIHRKCVFCRGRLASIRYEPCQHMISCRFCARRQVNCLLCGKVIERQTYINTI